MVPVDEGGVDAQVPRHDVGGPARGERAPRPLQPATVQITLATQHNSLFRFCPSTFASRRWLLTKTYKDFQL